MHTLYTLLIYSIVQSPSCDNVSDNSEAGFQHNIHLTDCNNSGAEWKSGW